MNVVQIWVSRLPLMQQSVLLSAIRGPDGVEKESPAKPLSKWLRRCVLRIDFSGVDLLRPDYEGGGNFTGPSMQPCENDRRREEELARLYKKYFKSIDIMPIHFHLHLMHAAEILGYKHPDIWVRRMWRTFYFACARKMHLEPETLQQLDQRLCDDENVWRNNESRIS